MNPVTLDTKNSNDAPSITCKFNVIATCNSTPTVHLETITTHGGGGWLLLNITIQSQWR